jgi:hypothetical protein
LGEQVRIRESIAGPFPDALKLEPDDDPALGIGPDSVTEGPGDLIVQKGLARVKDGKAGRADLGEAFPYPMEKREHERLRFAAARGSNKDHPTARLLQGVQNRLPSPNLEL